MDINPSGKDSRITEYDYESLKDLIGDGDSGVKDFWWALGESWIFRRERK